MVKKRECITKMYSKSLKWTSESTFWDAYTSFNINMTNVCKCKVATLQLKGEVFCDDHIRRSF